jgi:hypothetical protein
VSGDELFNRDELMHGSPTRVRRARALVYLIEGEAARSADQRAAMSLNMPMDGGMTLSMLMSDDEELMRRRLPGEADAAFVESFRNARRSTAGPSVRSLNNTTHAWSVLVPEDPALRAEVLHQLSLRQVLPRNRARSIAKVFGVDDPAFAATYQRIVGSDVSTAFGDDVGLLSKLRARLGR